MNSDCFCCCSVVQLCPILCDPMDCSMPGFSALHRLLELAQTSSPSRPGSWFGWPCNGGAEVSKAPVRCHTLWQPAPPGTVRPIFPCGRLACLASCELRFPAWAKSGSWRSFLRGSIPRAGVDLGDPSHRGRKNHMDRSMLCRRR